MRTDSTNLADKFTGEAKNYLTTTLGDKYALPAPRRYKKKVKLAQEAHEAIRPTAAQRAPANLKNDLDERQWKLYDLIWRRALASQMAAARLNATAINITTDNNYALRANGQTIVFDGYLKIYQTETKENILPAVTTGEALKLLAVKPEQHFTQPPARYSAASLIKV